MSRRTAPPPCVEVETRIRQRLPSGRWTPWTKPLRHRGATATVETPAKQADPQAGDTFVRYEPSGIFILRVDP